MLISSLLLGLIIGLVSSVLGLGGGILLVPLLPLVTGLSRKESVFISLTTILVIVSTNTFFFFRAKKINFRAVFIFGPLTAVGAFLAAYFVSPHFSNEGLRLVLASVLLLWGLINLYKVFWGRKPPLVASVRGPLSIGRLSYYSLLALIAGLLSGVLGIGSGLIMSLVLVGIFWVGDEQISPTSNAIMVFTTFSATMVYLFTSSSLEMVLDSMHTYTLPLVLGATFSSYFGRKYQHRLPRKVRAIVLITMLLGLSVNTFMS